MLVPERVANTHQLDLEMSFAKGEDVMNLVETLVRDLYSHIKAKWCIQNLDGQLYPSNKGVEGADVQAYPDLEPAGHEGQWSIPRITYQEAMSSYGSDKPDLRVPNKVCSVAPLASLSDIVTNLRARSNESSTSSRKVSLP